VGDAVANPPAPAARLHDGAAGRRGAGPEEQSHSVQNFRVEADAGQPLHISD